MTDRPVIDRAAPRRCGARTLRGEQCRNGATNGPFCRRHRNGAASGTGASEHPLPDRTADGQLPTVADSIGRIEQLQDAAERRALEAHQAGQDDVQQDAVFNRNARLAATLARTRLALAKAKASGEAGVEGNSDTDETEYDLPENERE
jgi:hypothetical protein